MANSAVVGTLRAVLSADTAEFAVAMKAAGSAAEKAAADMMKGSAAFEAAGAKMSSVTRLIKDFSGSLETRRAAEFAVAIEAIGGAAKLSESELRRANGVFSDFISKAQAMGKEVPAGIKKVADEVGRLANPANVGLLDQVKGAFTNLGPAALAAAGGFVTALVSVEALTQGLKASIQFVKESIAQYLEAEKAQRKMTAALQAQGMATPATVQAYKDLADQFQRTTVFSDDLITEMQTLLVQVGNVMPQDMEKALTAVTNLASGLGIDLRSATLMVAKASEDNFTALKKVIPALDQTRAEAEGLDYVLGLVNQKFGGQNQADLASFSGQLANLGNQFDELKEQVGAIIVESNLFAMVLMAIREQIKEVENDLRLLKLGMTLLGEVPGPVGMAFKVLIGDLKQTKGAIQEVETGWQSWKRLQQQQIDSGALTDYSGKLKELKQRYQDLSPEAKKQIEDAKTIGANMKLVGERYGFTAKELDVLTKGTENASKKTDKFAQDVKRLSESFIHITADAKALNAAFDKAAKSGEKIDFKAVLAEVNKLVDRGGLPLLSDALHKVWLENNKLADLLPVTSSLAGLFGAQSAATAKSVDKWGEAQSKLSKEIEAFNRMVLSSKSMDVFKNMPNILDTAPMQAPAKKFGDLVEDRLNDAAAEFPQMLAKAIISGQGLPEAFRGMMASLGGDIAAMIGKSLATAGSQSSKMLGSVFGALGGVLGDLVGQGISAMFSALKTVGRNLARDAQDAFATQELGFAHLNALMARLKELGAVDLVNRGDIAQRRDDEAATRVWMEDVRKFLADIDKKTATLFGQLASAVQDFGGKAPAALQPLIQQLLTINALTEDQRNLLRGLAGDPSWEDLQSIAQKYGIELSALGQKFQDARIGDIAMQYARDFMTLRDAGGDVNGLLQGMQDEVQALVNDARQFGTAMPEAMRPVIEGLISMGLLTDENGNKFQDLASTGVTFTGTMEDAFRDMKTILEQIRDLLARGLPGAARQGAEDISDSFKNLPVIRIPVEFDVGDFNPPSGFSVPQAHEGGRVTSDGLIYAHAGELIVPNDGDFGPTRIDNRLYIDGREVTVAVVQHLREVARNFGTRPI